MSNWNCRQCYPCQCIRPPCGRPLVPIYGGIYSADEFETTLVATPATVLPTNYVYPPLSGTDFNGSSLIVPDGTYLVHASASVAAQANAVISLSISNSGIAIVDGGIIERASVAAGVEAAIKATFYVAVESGALNLVMWADSVVGVSVRKCSLIVYRIDD